MEKRLRQVVAFGGGGFSMESGNPLLDDYVLGLSGAERPKVCFMPSASGDADHYIVRFYRAFPAERCEASHISLFRREQGPDDLREHLLSQDLIYVGGGSVVSLLGVWRAHGIDSILREAWERGVVLCGLSAGSLCWFAEAVSGFHGAPQRVEGLGLLPLRARVAPGKLADGLAALGVSLVRDRAGVDHAQVGRLFGRRFAVADRGEALAHELRFVLVHLAAERNGSQRRHVLLILACRRVKNDWAIAGRRSRMSHT